MEAVRLAEREYGSIVASSGRKKGDMAKELGINDLHIFGNHSL